MEVGWMNKKSGCPKGSKPVKGKCRSVKPIKFHGRMGNPIVHITKTERRFIMVRHPSGKGVKRLYEGSKYRENGKIKLLKL